MPFSYGIRRTVPNLLARRNRSAPIESRSMSSTLLPYPGDPIPSVGNTVVRRRLQFTKSLVAGTTNITVADVLTASGDKFTTLRPMKIAVWGPDIPSATSQQTQEAITVVNAPSSVGGDSAIFKDAGVYGFSRACVCYRPNALMRETFYTTTSTVLATVNSSLLTSTSIIVVEVSAELR